MVGFAILQGPLAHLKHIFSTERLPFTAAYLGSLGFTLYFALAVRFLPPQDLKFDKRLDVTNQNAQKFDREFS
jgi:hypothetical protein